MGASKQAQLLHTGRKAPDFTLQQLDGEPVSLSDLTASGPVLLAFFKISCPVCQFTFPFLERIHAGAAGGSLRVFGVSQDDAASTREFNERFGITLPVLLDSAESGYPVSNDYGISHVPTLYLIESGRVIGLAEEGFVRRDIERVGALAGVHPFRQHESVPEWKSG